ncbi:LADA_0E10396g1_1 [Lachancea dasiensis]|uniref:LADA_0E10396g1_1 n=1 Tax=Lachancea dasiensis TaxID=1072105 RepID=A0A1G4JED8_9SACH|nr:LADA_0E10396g1_1 [Lachancea dasiensis]
METTKHVSRKELFDSDDAQESQPPSSHDGLIPELEFVSVEPSADTDNKESFQDEYDFPLFSFGIAESKVKSTEVDVKIRDNDSDNRGRSSSRLMKVSLREPSPDIVRQERPQSYYFAKYTTQELIKFERSALELKDILEECGSRSAPFKNRFLDVNKHNEKIELERLRALKAKRRRPGKKQREARKLGAERDQSRAQQLKEVKKLAKKKFHKRGGKKNKKSAAPDVKPAPRFRTE